MRAVTSSRLSLVLPSSPDSPADRSRFFQQVQACAGEAGAGLALLCKMLARADRKPQPVADRQALVLYLLTGKVQAAPPVAALRAIADNLHPTADEYWLCADPVHLQPDLDHLLLFSGESFTPTPDQAEQLASELNQLFADDALEFIVGAPEHWYLRCPHAPDVSFTALAKVRGQNILPFMPAGKDAAKWRRYLNEIQMQMTASQVNQQRAGSGMAEINSVWCWGGGQLPQQGSSQFQRVYTRQAFTEGLSRHLRVEVAAVPDSAAECRSAGKAGLIEFADTPEQDDPQAMLRFLLWLEQAYLLPLWADLKQGQLDELVIYFAGKRFYLPRKALRRWWRRSRPLHELAG